MINVRSQTGFTLIEVIIAIAIFAVVATLSYTGLQSVINSKIRTEYSLERLKQLQLCMLALTTDMQQIIDRDGTDALGSQLLSLTSLEPDLIASMTRSGWKNPAKRQRSSLQRVAYLMDEDKLIRRYWTHVDRADDEQYFERILINNIEDLELRFIDNKNEFQQDWPSLNSSPLTAGDTNLPKAIEITLKLNDWGEVKRIVRLAN